MKIRTNTLGRLFKVKTELINDAFSNWDKDGKNDKAGYGFGWHIKTKNNRKYLEHGGSTTGFRTFVLRIPSEKITVAVYTNSSNYTFRNISGKGYVLASLYSDNQLPMPMDMMIEIYIYILTEVRILISITIN